MSSASRTEDQNAKAIGSTGANSTPSIYFKSNRTGVWIVTLCRLWLRDCWTTDSVRCWCGCWRTTAARAGEVPSKGV